MRKFIKGTYKKTAFSFDNIIYEQIDGVSMGSPLAPVLANIIMTEFEKTFVQKLTTSGMIKCYCRYVDDTVLLVKPADIPHIHNLFNKLHKNLRFTVDCFENEVSHFSDIKISPLGLKIYRKNTQTGQYINFEVYNLWNYKTSWTRSLVTQAKQVCSANLLPAEIQNIKKFASRNGYPKSIWNAIIKRTLSNSSRQEQLYNYVDMTKLYLNLPNMGNAGE